MFEKKGKQVLALCSLILFFILIAIFSSFVSGITTCWSYTTKVGCTGNTKCTWHDDAWGSGWCEQLDCWSFYSKTSCLNSNSTYNLSCKWQEPQLPPGWCEEVSCWGSSGTNQTVCENNTKSYGLSCLWGPTDPAPNYIGYNCFGGTQCYRTVPYSEFECKNITGCSWGSCYQKGCWDYTTSDTCRADTNCDWNAYNYCVTVSCYDIKHNTQASCANTSDTLNCKWNSQYNYCQDINCWLFNYNQTGCQNTGVVGLECNWKDPWCETKYCGQNIDETSCKGKTGYAGVNCTWRISTFTTTGWCEKIGCWNAGNGTNGSTLTITESQCVNNSYGLNCVWENFTWGASCYQNLSASPLSCANITDEKKCYDTAWCWWDSTSNKTNKCNEPTTGNQGGAIGGSFSAPGCWIFDLNISSCTNTTGCIYNATTKKCEVNLGLNTEFVTSLQSNGLNCSLLNSSNLCTGATFLPYCCDWQGSTCTENKYTTSCWDNLKKAPEGATFCEDSNAYTSESKCNEIANTPWYMPCRWNNNTKHCEFKGDKFFSQGEQGDADLVDNKDMCEKGIGGLWVTESYCGSGNMTNSSISVGRCAPKLGAQGGNCDTACFKCEFKSDGSNHSTEGAARSACESSALGFCAWRSDKNAPNGLGFCETAAEFKLGSVTKCDTNNCESCNSYNSVNAKTKCQEAKCEWKVDLLDTTKGFCASSGTTTCIDRCESCTDQKICVEKGRGVNGSCTWDTNLGFCKKTSSGDNTGAVEICFDGSDNDGDGKIDCADGGCFTDPFCGSSSIKDCWQYSNNVSCADNGCRWFNDTYGSWCDQQSAVCWQYDGDASGCSGQSACQWQPAAAGSTMCNLNESVWDECAPLSQSNCNTNSRCYWFIDSYFGAGATKGWCGHRHEICHFNQTFMTNASACSLSWQTLGGNLNCTWYFDPWAPTGGYCDSSCFSLGSNCNTNGMCKSKDGWCNPSGFGGNTSQLFTCFQFESQTTCTNQSNCKWFSDPKAACDVSRLTDCFSFKVQTGCNANINCSWTGFDANSGWCDQKVNRCRTNFTLSTNENNCNTDSLCFWKDWGGGYSSCEPKVTNSTTESKCTSLNGTWRNGWCDSAALVTSFTGMDMDSPPTPLGNDPCPETGVSAFSDICYFGMKDTKDNFGLGTGVANIRDAAICNGVTTFQGIGNGNNTAKFYWYIDSDGKTSGGCALNSNSSSVGWDLYFRYEASYVNGSVTESKKAHRCINSEWKATDIQLSAWKQKMCNEIQGGMISVNKDDLKKISGLLNLSSTLRFYAATANETGNVSSPLDTTGPAYFTPGTLDFVPECCWGIGDSNLDCDGDGLAPANDPDCSFMINKGFIPFEDCFGNGKDEDADGFTDCNDPDCKGNQYCVENKLGVEAVGYIDNIAPKTIYWNVEKYPDAAILSFDTDEPANGSVDFFYNSSTCVALNKTLYDVGIWNNKTQKYKSWHEVEIYNDTGINSLNYTLSANKTYFYKFKVCDSTGNCAQSACSNFSTVISSTNCKKCSFIFDMKLPSGWILDLDLNADGTYETPLHRQCGASSGILLNYTATRNVNLRFRENSSNTTLFFLGARLTRSLSHNEKIRDVDESGGIKSGTTSTTSGTTVGYTGLSKEISNKLVDKLHPKSCMIQVDKGTGSCLTLYHCDDNLKNCVRRDTEPGVGLNESGPNYCIWKMPCQFSTYAGGVPRTSSSSSSSSGGSSGGGGGGGGSAGGGTITASVNEVASLSRRWDSITSGATAQFTINNENIAITKVAIDVANTVTSTDIKVASLVSNPTSTTAASKVYQYLQLTKENIGDADASKITINFKVAKSWLTSNAVTEDNIVLYRYSESKWNELSTTKTGSDANDVLYQSITPGFSNFAIGSKEATPSVEQPIEAIAEKPTETPIQEPIEVPKEENPQITPQESSKKTISSETKTALIVVALIIIAIAVAVFYFKRLNKIETQ